MGATMMDNTRDVFAFARENGQDIHICPECDGFMLLYYKDLPRLYKGEEILLRNFPVIKCVDCGEEMYEAGDLLHFVQKAHQHYDQTGSRVFVCLLNNE